MASYFEWLQGLAFPTWIAESESIWGFPFVLFLHSVGMGLSAGSVFVVSLRLLGAGEPLLVSSLRLFPKIFWLGFFFNLVTGSILFAAHATITGYIAIYYVKLGLIALGVVLFQPLRAFVNSMASDGDIPARVRVIAALSIAVWVAVITTGRWIAYA